MGLVDWLVDVWNSLSGWYDDQQNQDKSNAITDLVALLLAVLGIIGSAIWWLARKLRGQRGGDYGNGETPRPSNGPTSPQPMVTMTLEDFQNKLEVRAQEVRAELAASTGTNAERSQSELDELERQLANITVFYEKAWARIVELERLLVREGNDIGVERLQIAREKLERGDYSEADAIFAEIKARDGLAVERSARASYGRGEIAEAQVRWLDAAEHYEEAARLNPTIQYLQTSGVFLRRAGQYEKAIVANTELVKLARAEHGNRDQKTATALSNLSESLRIVGRYSAALPVIQEALGITRQLRPQDEQSLYIQLGNLGLILMGLHRFGEAMAPLEEAVLESERANGRQHPDTARALHNLAAYFNERGKFVEAEPLAREAVDISKAVLGPDHPDTAIRVSILAQILMNTYRPAEAEHLFRDALRITTQSLGEGHPKTAIRKDSLGVCLVSKQLSGVMNFSELAEAEQLHRSALKIGIERFGLDHLETAESRLNLEVVLERMGRHDEAANIRRGVTP